MRVIWHVMMKLMISRRRERKRGRERRNRKSGGDAGGSQCHRRHQTAERKREENSVRERVSYLRAVITSALTRSNHKKKRTAQQNTKNIMWAFMLSHNIKSEKGTLEILSKQQSILASNVYTVWNGRLVSGVAQILLSEAETLHVTAAAAARRRATAWPMLTAQPSAYSPVTDPSLYGD